MEEHISGLNKLGRALYKVYLGIGIASMGVMAGCVIYAVIARYVFSVSHRSLEEFITTVFAFTTFWGMGICFVEKEHVSIDSFLVRFPKPLQKFLVFFNYAVVIIVLLVMIYFGFAYAGKYGHQISFGMRVPMLWMYGIIPVGCTLALICVIVDIVHHISSLIKGTQKGAV
jgi:TRAP-type C4-dicarboxylate transport system permease small subunit